MKTRYQFLRKYFVGLFLRRRPGFLLVLTILWFAGFVSGQDTLKSKKGSAFGKGYIMGGLFKPDISFLNRKLNQKGYPEISDIFVMGGGGGHIAIGKWLAGGEGAGLIRNQNINDSSYVRMGGGYGFLNVGYILHNLDRSKILFIIGMGGGGMDIVLARKKHSDYALDEILENPGKMSNISLGGFLMQGAMEYNFLFKNHTMLGVRGGYILSPLKNKKGDMFNSNITFDKAISLNGLYLSLMIGWW